MFKQTWQVDTGQIPTTNKKIMEVFKRKVIRNSFKNILSYRAVLHGEISK